MPTVTKSTVITSSTVPSNAMPLQIGVTPALWLDGADASTLLSDGAASFTSASSQYLSCASNSTLQTGNVDFWTAGWFYKNGSGTAGLITKEDGATGVGEFDIYFSTGLPGIYFFLRDGTTSNVVAQVSKQTVPDATWFFLFAYHDSVNDVIKLSYNQEAFSQSGSYTGTPNIGNKRFNLGAYSDNTYFWNGRIDSVSFGKPSSGWLASNATALRDYLYNGGAGRRSSDFINSSYYTGGNPSGAVSWWDLDEASGTRKDRIGSNDLTASASSPTYASGIASGNVQYDGDPIKQWSDKSGNGRHATAASDAVRPSYKVGITNGRSVVRYDGTDDTLSIASSTATFNFLHQSQSTVFIVASVGSSSDPNAYTEFITNNGGATANIGISLFYDDRTSLSRNNHIVCLVTSGISGQPPVSTSDGNYFLPQTVGILSFSIDPTNAAAASRCTIRRNGGNALSNNANTFTTSASNASFNLSVGLGAVRIDYHELIIYPAALSTSQRQRIERYLAEKWMSPPTVTLVTSSSSQYLEWAAVDMAGSYKVYYRVNGTTNWTLALTTTSLYAVVTGLTVGTAYDFRVDAVWSV